MIICGTCGERSGGKGTSLYGSVHKYGPTTHEFDPQEETWKYAPEEVLIVRGNAWDTLPVTSYIAHAPNTHTSPIKPELIALELKTARGSRWYGVKKAKINSELKMIFVPISEKDEVLRKLPDVPEDLI
jgi:hypothetical protein